MSETAYSPSTDMVEINRIHYELEYTEGISQRMRIPDRLKVGSGAVDHPAPLHDVPLPTAMMHVPERIVVAGEDADSRYSRPRDLDLIQSTPVESVALMAPPRVLTLNDQPLDFLEPEPSSVSQENPETPSPSLKSRRERCVSENSVIRHHGPPSKQEARTASAAPPVRPCPPLITPEDGHNLYSASGILSYIQCTTRRAYQQVLEVLDDSQHRVGHPAYDLSLEHTPEETSLVDAASLRRQIVKLNRRLHLLEREGKERTRREMIMYSVTVAFWLVNTWVWFRR